MDESGFKKAFGKRLRFLRELRHLTQAKLAERISVTEQYISMLERGLSSPSFSLVAQLSQTLRIHPAALFLFTKPDGDEGALPLPTLPENLSQAASCIVDPATGAHRFSPELSAWLALNEPPSAQGKSRKRPVRQDATPALPQSLFAYMSEDDARLVQQALDDAAAGQPAPLFSFRLLTAQPMRILAYASQQPAGGIRMVLMDVTDHLRFKQMQLDLQAAVETLVEERTQELQDAVLRLEAEVQRRQQSEAALGAAEERWRVLFDNAPVGIFQSLPEGRFQAVNREALAMFGFDSTQELLALDDIGQHLYVDPAQRRQFLETLTRQGAVEEFPVRMKSKDGRVFRAIVTARHLPPDAMSQEQGVTIIGFVKELPGDGASPDND